MTEPNEQEAMMLQKKYMEFQMLSHQVKRFREQIQQIDQQMVELDSVKDALEELKSVKKGADLFVPMNSGIFMKAKAEETQRVVLNVGAGVAVEKTVPEAQQLISEQMEQADKLKQQLMANLDKLLDSGKQLQAELEQLVK